jgi:hypothetical protein
VEQLLSFLGSGWAWLALAVLMAWSLFAARNMRQAACRRAVIRTGFQYQVKPRPADTIS